MGTYVITRDEKYLEHHGIKGQKWGVRRFQNEDGTLTAEGRARYGVDKKTNEYKSSGNYSEDDSNLSIHFHDSAINNKKFKSDLKKKLQEEENEWAKIDGEKPNTITDKYVEDFINDSSAHSWKNDPLGLDKYDPEYAKHLNSFKNTWINNSNNTTKHKETKKVSSNTKFKVKAYSAAGTAFLAGAGASLLVNKIRGKSFISGGYVVRKGHKGIHYRKSVGATVTKALLTGAFAALTVGAAANAIKAHKDKKENGGKE